MNRNGEESPKLLSATTPEVEEVASTSEDELKKEEEGNIVEENVEIPSPLEGESLVEFLLRPTDEELQQIFASRRASVTFCSILQTAFREFESLEDGLENLWNIISNLNNLDHLLHCISRLQPVRNELLDMLAFKEQEWNRISRLCTYGRLIGSTVDVAGTIGSLWMSGSRPGLANMVFRAASTFGFLGLASTLSEMTILRNSLDELMRQIRRDQELFAPIQRWYLQSYELEEAMQVIFPFDITTHIVNDFAEAGSSELTPARLLATLLSSIAEHDIQRVRDETLVRNLINFTLYPASQDWCRWIIVRRHPVILDITRIIIQLQSSPLQFTLSQSIPALAAADQRLSIRSFAAWGRITLNLVTIADALSSLTRSEVSTVASEIGHLRRHLQSELDSLQRIIEFIQRRRQNRRI